jgi:hypothetical protein
MERRETGNEIKVLDGIALVMGSAIASIHILRIMRSGLTAVGWVMICIAFAWVALTAAGPFIYLARRHASRLPNYPKVGDRLWAVLGLPWLITALIQSALPGEDPRQNPLFSTTLELGLALACGTALAIVWTTWVAVTPAQASRMEAAPWTNRVGLFLAVAWPIQCGLGMVVLS